MKRFSIILLCCIFLLSGCSAAKQEEFPKQSISLPPATPTTEPATNDVLQHEAQLYAVSVPAVTQKYQTENGVELFSQTTQHIQLILPDEFIADNIILDFLNRIDATAHTAESILAAAQNDYAPGEEWLPYNHQVIYSPMRIDQGVLSFFGYQSSYSGGLHGNVSCVAANYDLTTGDYLTLGSIMHKDATVDDFIDRILYQLNIIAEEYYLFEDFEEGVYARLSGDENLYEDFYFTQTGLCFFFSPYEIAPYASGVISVEIPYHELTGLIYDGYFPAEREQINGTMNTGNFMQLDMEKFNNMAEVTFVTGEEIMVAYAEGKVEDIRIRVAGDGMSRPEYVVFASFEMCDQNAVILSLAQEDIPQITISYTANNKIQTIPLA